MSTNMNTPSDRKKIVIGMAVIVLVASTVFLLFSLSQAPLMPLQVHGIYRIYSDDPAIKLYIQNQNTYIKLNPDKTIVYNTTINGKPKFHFEGTYRQQHGEIVIEWKDGKLPSKLSIEKKGDDQVIKIGSTMYKKERTGS